MISTFYNTHPPQKCHLISYVIQSYNIGAIRYEAESMPKIEFSSCCITFCGNISSKNWVLVTARSMLYWRSSFLVVASNFVKWIQNFIHSSFRFDESIFVRLICICIYFCIEILIMDQTAFVSATWKFPFSLSFWSFFLIFVVLDQILC